MNLHDEKETIQAIAEILTDLVKALSKNPAESKVDGALHGTVAMFIIRSDPTDRKHIIGKRGKHIKSLQVITAQLCKEIGCEFLLTIDEEGRPRLTSIQTPIQFNVFSSARLTAIKGTMERLIIPFLEEPESLEVVQENAGNNSLFVIRVAACDYRKVYGPIEMEYDYGHDGVLIGAIKNIFDGIGKNGGRVIRISLVERQPAHIAATG